MTTSTTETVRPRNLSDAAMDLAVRQAIGAVAGQARHTSDFFGRHIDNAGWGDVLQGCLDNLYEKVGAMEELQRESAELVIKEKSFDPRWEAVDKLNELARVLWRSERYDDAVRVDRIAGALQIQATPLDLGGRSEQTEKLRAELEAEDSELARTFADALVDLRETASRRGCALPVAVVAGDSLEPILDSCGRYDEFESADLNAVTRIILAA